MNTGELKMTKNKYEIIINDEVITTRNTKNNYQFFNLAITEYEVVYKGSKNYGQTFQQSGYGFSSKYNPIKLEQVIKHTDQEKLDKSNFRKVHNRITRNAIYNDCQYVYAKPKRVFNMSYKVEAGQNVFKETNELFLEATTVPEGGK